MGTNFLIYSEVTLSQGSIKKKIYIFWPIVEFSWKSRSTSRSKLHVEMHHVIPPTTCVTSQKIHVSNSTIVKLLMIAYFVKVWKAFDSSAKVSGCKKEFDRLSQLYFLFFILTHVKLIESKTTFWKVLQKNATFLFSSLYLDLIAFLVVNCRQVRLFYTWHFSWPVRLK